MMAALMIGAVVAYFTPAGSASSEGYFSVASPRLADNLAPKL